MNIAIVGSRTFDDYHAFLNSLIPYLEEVCPDGKCEFISGGAKGVDSMARMYAEKSCRKIHELKPDYGKNYPKIAPLIRNKEIAKRCDVMVAFWDGLSGGTANAIAWATSLGKTVKVFIFI